MCLHFTSQFSKVQETFLFHEKNKNKYLPIDWWESAGKKMKICLESSIIQQFNLTIRRPNQKKRVLRYIKK